MKAAWEYVQDLLDIRGDCVMLFYTAAVIWKMLHGGLGGPDACAYGAAVGALGYFKGSKNAS